MTFGDYKSALADALGSGKFWLAAELGLYIQESIRTYNAAAQKFRARGVFPTAANSAFYDLSAQVPALLGRTLTDRDLITMVEYHLLEPPTPAVWTGTEMFDLADLTGALQRRRDQFLVETGVVLLHRTQGCPPPPIGRAVLASDTIDVRRVAWKDVSGVYTNLWRVDEHQLNSYRSGWSVNPETPEAYSAIATPPYQVQLAPVPLDAGTLDLLVVAAGATLDPTAGIALGVPDDFAWVVKWGALADLLGRDGPARDPARSAYCESRWREGVQLARLAVGVMQAEVNGVPTPTPGSLFDLDTGSPGWHNRTGQPDTLAVAGLNYVALADVPDGIYSVTVDVVRNAPLPVADGDPVEVGLEEADAILGHAQHLALFKCGGAEFEATMPHYERLMRLAALHNDRLRAQAANFGTLSKTALREPKQRQRRKSDLKMEPLEYAES